MNSRIYAVTQQFAGLVMVDGRGFHEGMITLRGKYAVTKGRRHVVWTAKIDVVDRVGSRASTIFFGPKTIETLNKMVSSIPPKETHP
jgi:hypothetical protein